MGQGEAETGPRGLGRPAATARSALNRLGEEATAEETCNAFVMVPVGTDPDTCRDLVLEVQQALKSEAVSAGKTVGEFFPGHPMQGIHRTGFRPLAGPHPVLAVRAMVITDILFLTLPGIPAAERLPCLKVWHSRFGEVTGGPWAQLHADALAAAEKELDDR
ncbi:DUF6875 domain-containing protein [Streptomyces sp. NPDC001339]|uniref:DUF6875 domain-containing protein n=1 Tax=Streptomyces sp. NPDC001339 TaxID=3364563 RepID=UPI0036902A54